MPPLSTTAVNAIRGLNTVFGDSPAVGNAIDGNPPASPERDPARHQAAAAGNPRRERQGSGVGRPGAFRVIPRSTNSLPSVDTVIWLTGDLGTGMIACCFCVTADRAHAPPAKANAIHIVNRVRVQRSNAGLIILFISSSLPCSERCERRLTSVRTLSLDRRRRRREGTTRAPALSRDYSDRDDSLASPYKHVLTRIHGGST